MIKCLLDNAGSYIQYQLSSSQVLLGITPTIIAVLGTSMEEVCFVALIGRRRLLGLLLAAASPSIYTERAFKYQNPDEILKERLIAQQVNSTKVNRRWAFVLLEYVLVLAAITNVGTLNWQLGVRSVNTVNPNTVYMLMIWSVLGVITHVMGAVVFHMRVRPLDKSGQCIRRSTVVSLLKAMVSPSKWPTISGIYHASKRMAYREFDSQPKDEEGKKLQYSIIPESRCFTFLAWFLSVFIIFHIILGTYILSSTNFIGPKVALGVLARYILSVFICRVIVVYELAVQRVDTKFERLRTMKGLGILEYTIAALLLQWGSKGRPHALCYSSLHRLGTLIQ
jgi:hypothetical protein